MIDAILEAVEFVTAYAVIATAAFAFHTLVGVLSVGRAEVGRQWRDVREEVGWLLPVWILTAGIYPAVEGGDGPWPGFQDGDSR